MPDRRCQECGGPITLPITPGAPRIYCSMRCSAATAARRAKSSVGADVTLAVEAIGQVVGGFKITWYDEPFEGWDGLMEPDVDCSCNPKGGCYCCDGASVTREQVDALRRIGVEVVDAR